MEKNVNNCAATYTVVKTTPSSQSTHIWHMKVCMFTVTTQWLKPRYVEENDDVERNRKDEIGAKELTRTHNSIIFNSNVPNATNNFNCNATTAQDEKNCARIFVIK